MKKFSKFAKEEKTFPRYDLNIHSDLCKIIDLINYFVKFWQKLRNVLYKSVFVVMKYFFLCRYEITQRLHKTGFRSKW